MEHERAVTVCAGLAAIHSQLCRCRQEPNSRENLTLLCCAV